MFGHNGALFLFTHITFSSSLQILVAYVLAVHVAMVERVKWRIMDTCVPVQLVMKGQNVSMVSAL